MHIPFSRSALAFALLCSSLVASQANYTIGSLQSGYYVYGTQYDFPGSGVFTVAGGIGQPPPANATPLTISQTLDATTRSVTISNGTLYMAPSSSCGNASDGTLVVWSDTSYTWQLITQSQAGSPNYYAIMAPGYNLVWFDRTTTGHIILATPDSFVGRANWVVTLSS